MGMYEYEEIEKMFRDGGLTLLSETYDKVKDKLVVKDEDGYIGIKTVDGFMQKKCGIRRFDKNNPYTVHNISKIWLLKHAPEYELVSEEYINNTEKLTWRKKDGTEGSFETGWNDFKQGSRNPITGTMRTSRAQRVPNLRENVEALLRKYNPEWTMIEQEYVNNKQPLIFKNKEGYLSMRSYTNLRLGKTELPLFNSRYPDTSMYNLVKYLEEETDGIVLAEGEKFEGMNIPLDLICDIHGKFTVLWANFFYREQGCPSCMSIRNSKGEQRIEAFLREREIDYEHEVTFGDLIGTGGGLLKFDFVIYEEDEPVLLIEYQGGQHFKPVKWFGGEEGFKRQQMNDEIKREYGKNNNISLLEIHHKNYSKINEILNTRL